MHFVYVIKSLVDDSFYVGETAELEKRLHLHNSEELNIGFTKNKIPWEYHFVLKVKNKCVAKKIERHIKKMKSRKYLNNLVVFPEIGNKLVQRYS